MTFPQRIKAYRDELERWRDSLLERRPLARSLSEPRLGGLDRDGRLLMAGPEWAPLNWQASELTVDLRDSGLVTAADRVDTALADARGYVNAYDAGWLDWQVIGDEPYGPIDYVIEAVEHAVTHLNGLLDDASGLTPVGAGNDV